MEMLALKKLKKRKIINRASFKRISYFPFSATIASLFLSWHARKLPSNGQAAVFYCW